MATNAEITCLYFVQNVDNLPMEIDEDDVIDEVKDRKRRMRLKVGVRVANYAKRALSELETEDIIEYSEPKRIKVTDEGRARLRQLGEEHPLITYESPTLSAKAAKKAAKIYKQRLIRSKAEMAADFKEQKAEWETKCRCRTLQEQLEAAARDSIADDRTEILTSELRSNETSLVFIPGDPQNPLDTSSFRSTGRTYPTPSATSAPSPSSSNDGYESYFSMTPSFRAFSLTLGSDDGEGEPNEYVTELDEKDCPPESSSPGPSLMDATTDQPSSTLLPPSPSPLPPSSPLPSSSPSAPPSPPSPPPVTGDSDKTLVHSSPSGHPQVKTTADEDVLKKKVESLTSNLRSVIEKQNALSEEIRIKDAALKEANDRVHAAESQARRHAASRLQLLSRRIVSVFSLNRFKAENDRLRDDLENANMDIRGLEEELEDREDYTDNLHAEHQRTVNLMHQEIDELRDQLLICQKEVADLEGQLKTLRETHEKALRERDDLRERLRVVEAERDEAVERGNYLQMQLNSAVGYLQNMFYGMTATLNSHSAALVQNGFLPQDVLLDSWPAQV